MALPGTIGDPLKPIKDKLDDIERAVDKLSKDNAKDNSEEITELRRVFNLSRNFLRIS